MDWRFESSYLPTGADYKWLRGNHHGHSTVSDGTLTPDENIRVYEAEGYDYLALSEHDCLLDPGPLQANTGMCLIPAIEVTSRLSQTLMYLGARQELPAQQWLPRDIMQAVHEAGGLFIFNHPNWQPWPAYATDDLLDTMTGLRGIEIYTGVIERLAGEALATNRWDRLLSKGWRVYGHATDDQHGPVDHFLGWNCVQLEKDTAVTPTAIVHALATGRFYASTGVTITRVTADATGIELETDAEEIHWVGPAGCIVHKTIGGSSRITVGEWQNFPAVKQDYHARRNPALAEIHYLRAECLGRGHARAWTQPFWVTAAA